MPAAAQAQKARAAAAKPAAAGAKEEPEAESVRNLAYVVNSANDNIVTLQRTVTAQEELAEKAEAASALQRNYETLSRIRQADQREFMALKRLHEAQQDELKALQESVAAQTERSTHNIGRAASSEAVARQCCEAGRSRASRVDGWARPWRAAHLAR